MEKNILLRIFLASIILMIITYSIFSKFGGNIFSIDENQILYLFSTSAQVIAGLFGLSMTGYIFLKDTLDRALKDDETLTDVIQSLKAKYYQTIIFMSIVAILSITLCIICISALKSQGDLNNWMMNVSIILVINEVALIICFACNIIEPNKIEKLSGKFKRQLESQTKEVVQGDFRQFMKDFNEIELFLKEYAEIPNQRISSINYRGSRMSNGRIAELLYKNEIINEELFGDLMSVIKYRNYVVHSTDVTVEKAMCDKVNQVNRLLKSALGF